MRKMNITYTLAIEDLVRKEGKVTERAVRISSPSFTFEKRYNPNATSAKLFNSESDKFDTPFSICHPFRTVAQVVAEHYSRSGGSGLPKMKYDSGVNDAQQRLFGNILEQELDTKKKQEDLQEIPE